MFTNHWKTYGDPDENYPHPAQEVLQEQAKHWYLYPHKYLKTLPPDQYIIVRYKDLVADPQATVERIYQQFGIEITEDYRDILFKESQIAKRFKSKHQYSLETMGLDEELLITEFDTAIHEFQLDEETYSRPKFTNHG